MLGGSGGGGGDGVRGVNEFYLVMVRAMVWPVR